MTNKDTYTEMQSTMRAANEELMKALGDIATAMADTDEGEKGEKKVRKGLIERIMRWFEKKGGR